MICFNQCTPPARGAALHNTREREITMQVLSSRDHPEALKIIKAAHPGYRKQQFCVHVSESVCLSNTFWDGGSRSDYTAIDLTTRRIKGLPRYAPPEFNNPRIAPLVPIPPGTAIVETGYSCGQTATARIYVHPDNMVYVIGPKWVALLPA